MSKGTLPFCLISQIIHLDTIYVGGHSTEPPLPLPPALTLLVMFSAVADPSGKGGGGGGGCPISNTRLCSVLV